MADFADGDEAAEYLLEEMVKKLFAQTSLPSNFSFTAPGGTVTPPLPPPPNPGGPTDDPPDENEQETFILDTLKHITQLVRYKF